MLINEIFHSIQGESSRAGYPCTFVRLTECHLRCVYCDTEYAFHEGRRMTIDEVIARVGELGCRFVTITGGEPLLQEDVYDLIGRLLDSGYDLQVETSGAVDVSRIDRRARVILDIKTPGSGMGDRMDWDNLDRLKPDDEIKFVVTSRDDYVWARDLIRRHPWSGQVAILISPSHGQVPPADLASWMMEDGLAARLHLQLHKYIWGEGLRGV